MLQQEITLPTLKTYIARKIVSWASLEASFKKYNSKIHCRFGPLYLLPLHLGCFSSILQFPVSIFKF